MDGPDPPGRTVNVITTSESRTASEMLWVTKRTVFRARSQIRSSSKPIRSRVMASRAPNGSSIRRILGSNDSARAIDTRCCMPPDSSPGREASKPLSPTSSRFWRAVASRSLRGTPCTSSMIAAFSRAVRHGKSTGVWKTKPKLRSWRASCGCRPKTFTVPEEGGRRSAMIFSRVDLPHPEGPRMEANCPSSTPKPIPRRASTARVLPRPP